MANPVLMPQSGISVESCIIGSWKKSVGDQVGIGDILFDYETDKAAFECESTAEGIILEIFYQDGDEVEVLKPVCAVGAKGEDVSAIRAESGAGSAPSPAAAPDGGVAAAAQSATPVAAPTAANSGQPNEAITASGVANGKVSPRAMRAAIRLGLNVNAAVPTGPGGRVIERDVQRLAASVGTDHNTQSVPITPPPKPAPSQAPAPEPAPPQAPAPEPAPAMWGAFADEKFSKIRTIIASSMHASLQNTAQLTHHHSFDATEVQTARAAFKRSGNSALETVSIGDMVLYAVVKALAEHPDMNAHLVGGNTLRRFEDVNLGVAIDTPRGLMVPTIFAANKKSLLEISAELKRLAADARLGNINPDLLQGGSFTVSNLGPTGVEMFTPILNPPQVGILGVCGVTTKVKQTEDGIVTYPSMGMSLTYDHRAVDGAPASRFAQTVCEKLAQFSLLLD
jgi:pyruvate dehydrogenase E2 component (dihydrolipoamide acetyltransferase)